MIEVPDNNYIYDMYEREQDRWEDKSRKLELKEEIEHDELPFYYEENE